MSKRGQGEGSLRQRPDGKWEARLSHVDPDTGKRKWWSCYAATAEAAREELDQARKRLKAQLPMKDSSRRLADWIEHWSDTALEASDRSESTKELYRNLSRKHLCENAIGDIPLDKLRKSHIDGLIVSLKKKGKADSTVRSIYTVLRAVLDDAKLDALIAENPTHMVPRPRVARHEARHLPPDQVAAVLRAAKDSRHHPVLVLIAGTGLRRGEAVGVKWSAVNLTRQSCGSPPRSSESTAN